MAAATPDSLFYWRQLDSLGATGALAEKIEEYCFSCAQLPEAQLLLAELRRRQGNAAQAFQILDSISVDKEFWASCPQFNKLWLARYFHCYGLLRREAGSFLGAASAFLSALEACPEFAQSLFALQFTRLQRSELAELIGRLEKVASGSSAHFLLANQLCADWNYALGDAENSLIRSFAAAKAAVASSSCSAPLDHLALPSLPEALIVGAPKCGTTSMAAWLSMHPQIYMHPRKELHFFDGRWDRGAEWYKCQFPVFNGDDAPVIRMEATPNYLQIPEVPSRVSRLMPAAKIVILLRNPLERALSWCHHIIRQDGASGSPEEIIGREIDDLSAMSPEALKDMGWHGTNCLAGSLYHLQLERWYLHFPRSQVLVVQMEQLIGCPDELAWEIMHFLQVDARKLVYSRLPRLNAAPSEYTEFPRSMLQRASDILGHAFSAWEGAAR